MNHYELLEYLKSVNEVFLLEVLELTSEQLVDAFNDVILEKNEYLRQQINEQEI
jgi:hypothetical protein